MSYVQWEDEPDLTLYVVITKTVDGELQYRKTDGTFEAYNAAHWAGYAHEFPQTASGSGKYLLEFPETTGTYWVSIVEQAGGTPATTDLPSTASDPAFDAAGSSASQDWTAEERAQIRYQLGLDGTASAPSSDAGEPGMPILPTPAVGSLYGVLLSISKTGAPDIAGVEYTFQVTDGAGTGGKGYDSASQVCVTDASGYVTPVFAYGVTYRARRGAGRWYEGLEVPDSGTQFNIPDIVGRA